MLSEGTIVSKEQCIDSFMYVYNKYILRGQAKLEINISSQCLNKLQQIYQNLQNIQKIQGLP